MRLNYDKPTRSYSIIAIDGTEFPFRSLRQLKELIHRFDRYLPYYSLESMVHRFGLRGFIKILIKLSGRY